MREALQKRCELFVENRQVIKAAFTWEDSHIYPLCAGIYASKGLEVNADVMRSCRDLLKQKTGLFSKFRGTSQMATVTMLSLSLNPEEKMERMLNLYDSLKEIFRGSEYLAVTAAAIAELAEPSQYDQVLQRTGSIYHRMKESHPFLTTGEDSAFAALLALTDLDVAYIEQEMEVCYRILKPKFFSSNAVHSLSHTLVLGNEPAEHKCGKTLQLFEYLKSHGYKYGTNYELATLGVLALLETDIAILSRDIMEVDDFLKTQKGFGMFGIGAKQRLMYVGMMTMCDYIPNVQTLQVAALNGIVSLVIAQEVAICASIAAASAAAAASSASS